MTGTVTPAADSDDRVRRIRERFARLGCAQLADAGSGHVTALRLPLAARNGRPRVCGPVFPVVTDDDMLPCLEGLAAAPVGAVLLLHNRVTPSEALVGDVYLTSAAVQGVAGVVVNGAVRDLADAAGIDVPLFSTEVTFVSARTTDVRAAEIPTTVELGGAVIRPGDWIFGDEDGFLVVEQARVGAVVSAAAVLREREEQLRRTMRDTGRTLAELTNLTGYLDGTGELGFAP